MQERRGPWSGDMDPTITQLIQHMVNSDASVSRLLAENERLREEIARLKAEVPEHD